MAVTTRGACESSSVSPAGLLAWGALRSATRGPCVPYVESKTFLVSPTLQEVTGAGKSVIVKAPESLDEIS